jgi:pimeloyl-ACP methyl ester carboxylesterase
MSMNDQRIESVTRDGLEFGVRDEGPIDGPPIVLLHGFPERATAWRNVAPKLHAGGFRTLAMDQRGYAPGARPKRRRDYRVAELVADVDALVDAVGAPVHLVGHDWGAMVAWSYAAAHPDRVHTLTAVSVPHPKAFLKSFVTSTQGLHSWYMFAFQLPGGAEWLARSGRMRPMLRRFGAKAEEIERFEDEVVADGALRGGLMWYRALPVTDPRTTAGAVTVPTTLVWSTDDVALGRWGAEHAGEFVDAPYELVVLAGVSHWIPTPAPDALAEAILERVTA